MVAAAWTDSTGDRPILTKFINNWIFCLKHNSPEEGLAILQHLNTCLKLRLLQLGDPYYCDRSLPSNFVCTGGAKMIAFLLSEECVMIPDNLLLSNMMLINPAATAMIAKRSHRIVQGLDEHFKIAKFAAHIGDEVVLKQSLKSLDRIECTPRHLAIIRQVAINRGHEHLLHLLPAPEPDEHDHWANTRSQSKPTFVFDKSSDMRLVKTLINQNKELRSVIMFKAAEAGRVDIVRQLHNVNDKFPGETLGIAVACGNLDVVRYIIEHTVCLSDNNDDSGMIERLYNDCKVRRYPPQVEMAKYLRGVLKPKRESLPTAMNHSVTDHSIITNQSINYLKDDVVNE
ncbi:hypothetical protein SAMD00019534_001560 [Acytostelium subglobosum LB1]|uniref:hypothetical protein n=1 Tax=Acytostelium subglobosum LB1 TaxID=1410327 RepID=UPI0006448C5C|nr:hypothetical protein SAMD00019534_001560 [Acytostelium subglobosum LB1]GAM16981.1 hypothetical protein SAMD00019534_001560 [Acytostelium subglobosum LB1]|eukprot:XP_012759043.1 hypothetical protein SAMD00019534_001560 [Acytostelium subglobosum LB1]